MQKNKSALSFHQSQRFFEPNSQNRLKSEQKLEN